jgi:hypothetical protein
MSKDRKLWRALVFAFAKTALFQYQSGVTFPYGLYGKITISTRYQLLISLILWPSQRNVHAGRMALQANNRGERR